VTGGSEPLVNEVDVRGLVRRLAAEGATVATAESVTGGRLVAALTSVAGSSAVVRGAVVAYASDVKASMLGVDLALLAQDGPVCADVAEQMARGVRARMGATYGVSTTGEAGPDSASGRPVGTVFIAVDGPRGTTTRLLEVVGTRAQIQQGAMAGALLMLAEARGPDGLDSAGGSTPGSGNNGD
jgi:nicotinamide-nucleotide amidase